MGWTSPRTWTTGELVTAAIMNTHIRDNLNATAVGVSTTKGDLAPATAGSTLARLGIGADGNRLVADSACSVGMKWFIGGFSPLMAPSSPNAGDDEFSDNALSASWTEWDAASILTITETQAGATLAAASSGSALWAGMFKAVPASPYTVWAYVSSMGATAGITARDAGIVFLQDGTAPTTTGLYTVELSQQPTLQSLRWIKANNYTNAGAVALSTLQFTETAVRDSGIFLRARYGNGSMVSDYSRNGITWNSFGTSVLCFVPLHVGLTVFNQSPASAISIFPFFRQTAGSEFGQTMLGGRS